MADRILWDRDFEDGDMFVDNPAGESDPNDTGNIVHEYFSDIPRDPPDKEIPAVFERLMKIARSSPSQEAT